MIADLIFSVCVCVCVCVRVNCFPEIRIPSFHSDAVKVNVRQPEGSVDENNDKRLHVK